MKCKRHACVQGVGCAPEDFIPDSSPLSDQSVVLCIAEFRDLAARMGSITAVMSIQSCSRNCQLSLPCWLRVVVDDPVVQIMVEVMGARAVPFPHPASHLQREVGVDRQHGSDRPPWPGDHRSGVSAWHVRPD